MVYRNMISDAFGYTHEALVGKWMRWVLMTIVSIIPIVNFITFGYMMEIYRGTNPAPELENWGTLFMNGLKFFIVSFLYHIIPVVIFLSFGGIALIALIPATPVVALASLMGGFFIALIVALILDLLFFPAAIRFARTGSILEAFNFGAILDTIGRIGWLHYIISLVIFYIIDAVFAIVWFIVIFIVALILGMIPIIGWILAPFVSIICSFIIAVLVIVFAARYMTLVYDSA